MQTTDFKDTKDIVRAAIGSCRDAAVALDTIAYRAGVSISTARKYVAAMEADGSVIGWGPKGRGNAFPRRFSR